MNDVGLIILDAAAITLLVFGIYFPRHRRRDMVVAFLVVNVGVLAVSEALLASTVSAGLGLGLFGVLSIIRLRSYELTQQEVAYYFAALALGLLGGLTTTPSWATPVAMLLIIVALYVGDHPALFGTYRSQTITLDAAFFDEEAVRDRLGAMLGARVHRLNIRKVDLVRDTTTVTVQFQVPAKNGRKVS